MVVSDEADRWTVRIQDLTLGKEVWRQEDLSPSDRPVVPGSLWQRGHLYQLESVRRMRSGQTYTNQHRFDVDEAVSPDRTLGYSVEHSISHVLESPEAVRARLSLKEERTGELLLPPTVIESEIRAWANGKPMIEAKIGDYLGETRMGARIRAIWEEVDADGHVLGTGTESMVFQLRPSYRPVWQEGSPLVAGGSIIEWQPVQGARWVHFVLHRLGEQPIIQETLPGTATQYRLPADLALGTYWISLAAEGPNCAQDWAGSKRIVVDRLPFKPILAPVDGTAFTTDLLTVKLNTPEWMNEYLVELFDVKTGYRLQVRRWQSWDTSPLVTFETIQLVPGHSYRVRATATTNFGLTLSDEVTVTYQPPLHLALTEPKPGARYPNAALPVAWERVVGAQQYELLLTSVGFVNLQRRIGRTADTRFVIPAGELASGRTYRLQLVVTLGDGRQLFSDPVTFTVE